MTAPAANPPDISIVIAVRLLDEEVAGSLEALSRECAGVNNVEIIAAGSGEAAGLRERFPNVVLLSLPDDTPIGMIRGAAVRRSAGRSLVLLTSACRVLPGWLEALCAALQKHPVVGGAVKPAHAGWGIRDWSAFWCEYGQYLPPLRPGPAFDLTGNNVAYRRDVLAAAGALDQGASFWKAVAHRRLRAAQVELWAEPALVVRHEGKVAFGPFLWRRFHHGRCYAAGRVRDEPQRRWRFVLAAPLLPMLFVARLYASVWPKGRYRRQLLLATPLLWALYVPWAIGELLGAMFGEGDSCERAY